jgi:hypothetical protein
MGFKPRIVAERRNVDVVPSRRVKDGGVGWYGYVFSVYGKIRHSATLF